MPRPAAEDHVLLLRPVLEVATEMELAVIFARLRVLYTQLGLGA